MVFERIKNLETFTVSLGIRIFLFAKLRLVLGKCREYISKESKNRSKVKKREGEGGMPGWFWG